MEELLTPAVGNLMADGRAGMGNDLGGVAVRALLGRGQGGSAPEEQRGESSGPHLVGRREKKSVMGGKSPRVANEWLRVW